MDEENKGRMMWRLRVMKVIATKRVIVGSLLCIYFFGVFIYHGVSWERTKKFNEKFDAWYYAENDGETLNITVRLEDSLRDERNFLVIDYPYDSIYLGMNNLISGNYSLSQERSTRHQMVFGLTDHEDRTYHFQFKREKIGKGEFDERLPMIFIFSEKDWLVTKESSYINVRYIERE
ncbi:hypothetical protein FIU87_16495 [Bacillus sp. THAF10]|uniref:hypothetical protein n=1 Tax=Bacillus sp. THAF10 TaxID=2587848 RepID=UPI00126854A3|nr:hypothetical protein [Bacillus sp. THAF10]QFT90265.1 hypothetical protein FIU87_16495 [Bacillus sp. THAF10]